MAVLCTGHWALCRCRRCNLHLTSYISDVQATSVLQCAAYLKLPFILCASSPPSPPPPQASLTLTRQRLRAQLAAALAPNVEKRILAALVSEDADDAMMEQFRGMYR